MSEQILATLKRKLDDLAAYGELDAETRRNALKEELQFYVLNFIYHHPEYNKWIMYGGSALRIIHDLNRMSVDLDFEIASKITEKFLEKLKEEIGKHFKNTYGVGDNFLTIKITTGRGLLLKFHVGEELSFGHPSKQVHVKIDLNCFVVPKTVVIEHRPINHDQLSFVVATYNMSALMASKIAAIFLRGTRGIDKVIYKEKGRDIYDLLWYMEEKATPDFDYLAAKNVKFANIKELFNKITIKVLNNEKTDKNLKQDLPPLFVDQTYIKDWIENWRNSYFRLFDEYKINTVTTLESIEARIQHLTGKLSFICRYRTAEDRSVEIIYTISDYLDGTEDMPISIDNEVSDKIKFANSSSNISAPLQERFKQYATLFNQKNEKYFKKTNRIILGNRITTKIIRTTAKNLNLKEQILLDKSTLLSCELDDLLR